MFKKLCSADALHSVILATTNWDFLGGQEAAMLREQELNTRDEYWGLMMKRGSSILRHTGDKDSAMRILGTLGPLHHTKPMDSQYDYHMEPIERKRGLSESRTGFESQSTEATVNQLLAEYTTVVDIPPAQRRWT